MTRDDRTVNLALVQMACTADKGENVDKAEDRIAQAARSGAQIICLQEVFNTLYPCQTEDHAHFDLAEEIPGPTSTRLQQLAKAHQVVIVCSIFERRAPGLYHNTALTFDTDGELVGFYRKMHIPDDPNYYEKFYFTPGDLGFTVAKTRHAVLGVGVCWDQWYPEAARLFALRGAEILLYPTAIGWLHAEKDAFGTTQHDAWQTSMRAHAIANGLYVGAANRVGVEDGIEFWGQSFIANPNGTLLALGSPAEEQIVMAACELGAIDVVRTHWPFLRDRRVDAYGELTARFLN
ncbi:MAG: acyltransferase [Planctomycetota bacterium]|nr:MAG: acyltransferase [Planctomycetota bacterium]